ncbi:phage integrase N-terminal domain-containing protein [Noviherbaspirillum aerium]|uniref:phage integrase N-terminal domain-containing protein n=1 Tax=Noviherbaspirillum aerium TaxID=2588497 RepID=UPI00124EF59A|nr:phage integrase N-terminal domain-containing protein [Noviherbaspirillum aerium]
MEVWEGQLNTLLAELRRVDGGIASERTKDATEEAFRAFMRRLRELGHPVQKLTNVGDRHIRLVVRNWYLERGLNPKTIQNYVSRLKVVFSQMGKPNLVHGWQEYLPDVSPDLLVVKTSAVKSKGFTANGVDVAKIIAEADRLNDRFGLMLRLELAFGLRREEVLHCRPWIADRGTDLRVYPGEGKSGRSRDIPIESDHQRQILKYVQTKIGKTKHLGWEYDGNGRPTNLEKNLKRYENLAHRLGLTKA